MKAASYALEGTNEQTTGFGLRFLVDIALVLGAHFLFAAPWWAVLLTFALLRVTAWLAIVNKLVADVALIVTAIHFRLQDETPTRQNLRAVPDENA